MERRSLTGKWRGLAIVGAILLAGATLPAQTPAVNAAPPGQAPAQTFAPQQLDNLVGPIALYPDPLLGQVLAASTYPVELMEAEQWLQANPNLHGQQLMDAARAQNWDPSVQALVAMPDVLSFLTQDIRWTTDLGNAFLAQQGDVMSAVQRMRQTAQANGQLRSTPQETVTTEDQNGQQAIEIEPANPQVIYVPEYDPYYVYGWGTYPPLYYPDGYWFGSGIDIGLYFGGWGGWGFGGWGWGWGPNWFGRTVFVNDFFFNRYGFHRPFGFAGSVGGRGIWAHDPGHRLGAIYPRGAVANRFSAASTASRMAEGRAGNWRGFTGNNAVRSQGFQNSSAQRFSGNAQRFSGNTQRFSGNTQQFSGNAQRFAGSAQRFSSTPAQQNQGAQRFRSQAPIQQFRGGEQNFRSQAPAQRFPAAPQQRFSAPMQQRSAPAFSAPQRSFQAAPRTSAPSFNGGGGARSFGGGAARSFGGGGGGARSFGGGGGASHGSGGGGGHGGRR